jgi:hypothetical protein
MSICQSFGLGGMGSPVTHKIQQGRRRGPQLLGNILPELLGTPWGGRGTIGSVRGADLHRSPAESGLSSPLGDPLTKLGALSEHQRLIRLRGVGPLIYQYGEQVIFTAREAGS